MSSIWRRYLHTSMRFIPSLICWLFKFSFLNALIRVLNVVSNFLWISWLDVKLHINQKVSLLIKQSNPMNQKKTILFVFLCRSHYSCCWYCSVVDVFYVVGVVIAFVKIEELFIKPVNIQCNACILHKTLKTFFRGYY